MTDAAAYYADAAAAAAAINILAIIKQVVNKD